MDDRQPEDGLFGNALGGLRGSVPEARMGWNWYAE